jgi:hypothetical protein
LLLRFDLDLLLRFDLDLFLRFDLEFLLYLDLRVGFRLDLRVGFRLDLRFSLDFLICGAVVSRISVRSSKVSIVIYYIKKIYSYF